MLFNKTIGLQLDKKQNKIIRRKAVRGIITVNNKILLVLSNKGDYKLPGGGIEVSENHETALIREVVEETGYFSIINGDKQGMIVERYADRFESDAIFEMTSYYYFCELTGKKSEQNLQGYEMEQNFKATWMQIDEAIRQNEMVSVDKLKNDWVERETYVLKQIRKLFEKESEKI
ncbi:NUDIX domain-containing protein [Aquibacillus kalidii]|uniref:NUDIX domain-containing protein n=1 Tax=Aquibacillus kalidii TaxID=2762597 RepID=UPI0016471EDE|nr:NUDIX domain-containing protein [Aquibacillus kalidii]